MTPAPLAVFDLDGTLVDTGPDLAETCDEVLVSHGFPAAGMETIGPYVGVGGRAMLTAGLSAAGVTLGEETLDTMLDDFLRHYERRIAMLSRPFPEMRAAMNDLSANGVTLAICTNKREHLARKLMTELSLIDRFAAIVGGDTCDVRKPDPLPLHTTIERAGGHPSRTVFVGDSRIDAETAQRARLPFVGITYGYSDTPMAALQPDRLLGPGEDVAAAVLDLLGAAPSAARE